MSKYGHRNINWFEAIVNKLGGEEEAERFLRGELVMKAVDFIVATFKDEIDYNRSIADSVKAGKYDWANKDITDKNFPSVEKGKGEPESALFHFNREISSESAIEEMKKAGYRPATIKELLNFGEKHPDVQREFPVVTLGSVTGLGGCRYVGGLHGDDSERGVDLRSLDGSWAGAGYCRFLAVRN